MNKVKLIIKKKHIDLNGHISEAGYLTIANEAIWKIFENIGLNDIFRSEQIGPIIFDTHMHFRIEAFEGDEVLVHLKAKISQDNRKIFREINIFNQSGKVIVYIESNGAFLDLRKRKVIFAVKRITKKFDQYLSD